MKNDRPATLIEALRYFSDPDVCQDFMVADALARWRRDLPDLWPDGR